MLVRPEQEDPVLQPARRSMFWTALVAVGVAVPVVFMVGQVLAAPTMPTLDYWTILGRAVNGDGSLYERGLVTFQNGHPTFLPALVYYLNAAWFGGTETVLGLLTVVLGLATLAVLLYALPRKQVGNARWALAAIAFSWLMFAPKGLHNFAYGFSGVAWLSANLFVCAAIVLAARGRYWWALLPALAACTCYGSGFAVWPAVLVVLALRRAPRRAFAATIVAAVAVGAFWLTARPSVPGKTSGGGWPSYVQAYVTTLGGLWTSTSVDMATVLGLLTAGAAAALVVRTVRLHRGAGPNRIAEPAGPSATTLVPMATIPWLGLLVWAAAALLLISSARSETGTAVGLDSRYASLPALVIVALLALTLLVVDRLDMRVAVGAAVLLTLLGIAGSTDSFRQIQSTYPGIRLSAVALRTGATGMLTESQIYTNNLAGVARLGAYPFNDRFSLGCGNGLALDSSLATADLPALPGVPQTGQATGITDRVTSGSGVRLDGWAVIGGRPVDCVLLVDNDRIVGGGVTGFPRSDAQSATGALSADLGWTAVAPPGTDPSQIVVVVVQSGHRYVLPAREEN